MKKIKLRSVLESVLTEQGTPRDSMEPKDYQKVLQLLSELQGVFLRTLKKDKVALKKLVDETAKIRKIIEGEA